jgi:hypothetical protein
VEDIEGLFMWFAVKSRRKEHRDCIHCSYSYTALQKHTTTSQPRTNRLTLSTLKTELKSLYGNEHSFPHTYTLRVRSHIHKYVHCRGLYCHQTSIGVIFTSSSYQDEYTYNMDVMSACTHTRVCPKVSGLSR